MSATTKIGPAKNVEAPITAFTGAINIGTLIPREHGYDAVSPFGEQLGRFNTISAAHRAVQSHAKRDRQG